MTTKEDARAGVAELVEKFQRERNRQQSEADVRAGYIDQLFLALGWNVHNDPGQHTNYWREKYVRGAGFVDVGLELGGQPVLFLEAKRFSLIPESSKRTGDRTPEEKQAFRYTRGRKIQYAILTNFERLHLFNADHERLIGAFDSPEEYLERFDELWRLTPEEVSGGSLGWWERDLEKKDVDLEFLKWLREWRLTLASAIFEHNASNPELQKDGAFDFDKLMGAVQRILARLILVRYGDDKEVLLAHDLLENTLDDYRKRGAYASKEYLMRAFVDISHEMDKHHNTTLFAPDHLCEKIVLPNEVLASVLEDLNRISFRKFTSDILGNTYESYLGTKLKLVNGKIQDEARTDIRKGQGIYYTPSWVVDYIVDKTLGERLRELEREHGLHAIEKVRGLSVLDPACGSGSFLIKAYHVLAHFYQRVNQGITQEQAKLAEGFASADMFERLERISHLPQLVPDFPQVILQEHLYGVDLDPEAAEIATVNLTMQAFADSRQKKLPHILNENIKVGNSLISGTEEELKPYFGEAWLEQRPFNWKEEFPTVMEHGGFDVVIGNPPYGYRNTTSDPFRKYYANKYTCMQGNYDLYKFFVEHACSLLTTGGHLGFIISATFLVQPSFEKLRNLLLESTEIIALAPLGPHAFATATVDTAILVARRNQPVAQHRILITAPKDPIMLATTEGYWVSQARFQHNSGSVFDYRLTDSSFALVRRLFDQFPALDTSFKIGVGINTGFIRGELVADRQVDGRYHRMVAGDGISRYGPIRTEQKWIMYDKEFVRNKGPLGRSLPPEDFFTSDKILVVRTRNLSLTRRIVATLDRTGAYNLNRLSNIVAQPGHNLFGLLGILNSALLNWLFETRFYDYEIKPIYLRQSPLADSNSSDLIALVEEMLALQARLSPLRSTPSEERAELERRVAQVDWAIDEAVYALYGLTDAERRLVEGEG